MLYTLSGAPIEAFSKFPMPRNTEVFEPTFSGTGVGAPKHRVRWNFIADVPIDTPNARAAAATFREIQSVLIAGGVPSRAVILRHYRPDDARTLPTIKLSYPKISAVAGPCGLWPDDLGPNIDNPGYNENRPYHNFGCATQRNLAAMIDNPADLEQPRPETPAYTSRRNIAFEKYRKGNATTTVYPEAEKDDVTHTGK